MPLWESHLIVFELVSRGVPMEWEKVADWLDTQRFALMREADTEQPFARPSMPSPILYCCIIFYFSHPSLPPHTMLSPQLCLRPFSLG